MLKIENKKQTNKKRVHGWKDYSIKRGNFTYMYFIICGEDEYLMDV